MCQLIHCSYYKGQMHLSRVKKINKHLYSWAHRTSNLDIVVHADNKSSAINLRYMVQKQENIHSLCITSCLYMPLPD